MNKEELFEKLSDYKRASNRLHKATKIQPVADIIYDGVIQRLNSLLNKVGNLWKCFLNTRE